ncbi:MAG: alpha/beta hydrolase family protein [Glaciimonas sp.]|nr:alpha/beta hydrolase family protein [Glaciimonas sp.]
MNLLSFIDGRLGKLDQWYFHCHRFANRRSPAMFHRGWGNTEVLAAVNAHWRTPAPPPQMEITWETTWLESKKGVQYRRGSFPTPAYKQYLPLASARAYCHFVRPSTRSPSPGREPVVVLMPTSREIGVTKRLPLAHALAKQGITSLLLESPLMGRRKSDEQHGTTLSYFSDFLLLAAASIEEGRAALGWLSDQGYDKLGCTAALALARSLKVLPSKH